MMTKPEPPDVLVQAHCRKSKISSPSPQGEGQRVRLNIAVITLVLLTAISCNRKPFVTHKLKFEKISDNCENLKPSFRMVSNVAGERFEFEKCLDAGFTKEMMKVSRQGDTVVVQFSRPGRQSVLDKITLDIDSYPRYNFITVDDETFNVIPSN